MVKRFWVGQKEPPVESGFQGAGIHLEEVPQVLTFRWKHCLAGTLFFCSLGTTTVQARPWSEVRPEAVKLLQSKAPAPEKLLEYAEFALRSRDLELAIALAEEAVKAQPREVRPLMALVKARLFQQQPAQARVLMPRLLELSSRSPEALSLEGMTSILEGRPDAAVATLEDALKKGREQNFNNEQMGNVANILLVALYQNQQKEQALARCRTFLIDYPEEPDLWLSAGRLYREAGQFQAALETSDKAILRFPHIANFWAAKSLAEMRLGQKQASESSFAELRQRDPELAKALRPILDGKAPDQAQIQLQVK